MTISKMHQERTKIKDFNTEIFRLENLVNYHDTKMMNVLGLMMKYEVSNPLYATSQNYATLQQMYKDASDGKASASFEVQEKKDSYEQYQAALEDGQLPVTPRELSYKQGESVSCLEPDDDFPHSEDDDDDGKKSSIDDEDDDVEERVW